MVHLLVEFITTVLSYVTVTYVIEAMAAANAWSLSIERKAKSRSVQGQRQITDHSLTVSQTVSHHGRLSLACLLSCY